MRISDWSSDVCSSDLQELARLQQPAARAQGYALEQISAHLDKAVQTVVGQKKVSLLLRPEAAFFAQPTVDITPAITTELDRVVPSVSISPPANWQPGQQHQQPQHQAAPAAAPAQPQPQARCATPASPTATPPPARK